MLSRRAFAPDLTLVRPDHRSRAVFSAMSQPLEDDDFAAFMAVFVAHQRRIFGYIGSLLPTSADHEDVYQQTCMALWRKRPNR